MSASSVGPFALEERLDPAGKGNVFRAVHLKQRRQVALKLFTAPLATDRAVRDAFTEEMELLKSLKHPNIVRCYGGGIVETQGYLAMEIVPGEPLSAVMQRRGRMSWDEVVEVALQISSALQFAHERDLTHQDLTPDKLLLTRDGQVKVVDFRHDRRHNRFCVSSNERSLPRVAYLSPEQLSDAPVTHKSDLYSLGCVLFEMLTGRTPFEAATAEEMADQHRHEPPPRVASIALDCPIWLDVVVSQLLEKDPIRRTHGAAALSLALNEAKKKLAAGTGVAEHAAGGISALRMPVAKAEARKLLGRREPKKDRPAGPPIYERVWFLAGLLVLIAVVVTWFAWPASEKKLFTKAEALMATDDPVQWSRARRSYLEPLQKRFPDGQYADQVQEYLDQIDAHYAMERVKKFLLIGREPTCEGERLVAEAWRYETFGDRVAALEKYQSIVDLGLAEESDRKFVLLAKRQIARLLHDDYTDTSGTVLVERKLDQADDLYAAGDVLEAQKLWRSIVSLYSDNREMAPLVDRAKKRLEDPADRTSDGATDSSRGDDATDNGPLKTCAGDAEP